MIYFVASSDELRVKIGTTIRLSQRIKQLTAEYGDGLKIVAVTDGSFVEEAALHRKFLDLHIGGEWFHYDRPIADFIREHADAWDGIDEEPQWTTKIDAEIVAKAKHVVLVRRISLAQYFSDLLRGPVERDFNKDMRKITGHEEPPK